MEEIILTGEGENKTKRKKGKIKIMYNLYPKSSKMESVKKHL
jgi:hypothetical protein